MIYIYFLINAIVLGMTIRELMDEDDNELTIILGLLFFVSLFGTFVLLSTYGSEGVKKLKTWLR